MLRSVKKTPKHWYKAMSIILQGILIVTKNIKAHICFIILFQNQNEKEKRCCTLIAMVHKSVSQNLLACLPSTSLESCARGTRHDFTFDQM